MNDLFKTHDLTKKYWALVKNAPPAEEGTLTHYIVRNEKQNKSYAYAEKRENAKLAILDYKVIAKSDNYYLLEIDLKTGRHHQIRCQLSKIGCPIKGDLKYGFARSNPDGGISLHAHSIDFEHPVSHNRIHVVAPVPDEPLWKAFEQMVRESRGEEKTFVVETKQENKK